MKNTLPCGKVPTVLVVEDDPETLASDCRILGSRFPVLAATNGEDALRMANRAHPSVIILDVMLPGGRDGFSIFRILRSQPATQDIPVVFLTAVNQATGLNFGLPDLSRYLGGEPAAFLEKPVSADHLLATVTGILGIE